MIRSYLELKNQIHSSLAKRVDVIKYQSYDNVDTITLMYGDGILQQMYMYIWLYLSHHHIIEMLAIENGSISITT